MSETFDISGAEHDKTRRMLQNDLIAWFTTVDSGGRPHAVPVWFMWHGGALVVFSEPQTVKVSHVRAGSSVLVHLQAGGEYGDDVVILSGRAEISARSAGEVLDDFRDAYVAKYAGAIDDYGMPLEAVTEKYSTAIVFTPEHLLAW
jgi:PPOX class probable F420-dependent enzyme